MMGVVAMTTVNMRSHEASQATRHIETPALPSDQSHTRLTAQRRGRDEWVPGHRVKHRRGDHVIVGLIFRQLQPNLGSLGAFT
jgi:hypothetical protein